MKKQDIVAGVKVASNVVIGIGVGTTVGNIIGIFLPKNANILVKVCCIVGGMFMGNMVVDAVNDYSDKKIDETVALITELVDLKKQEA